MTKKKEPETPATPATDAKAPAAPAAAAAPAAPPAVPDKPPVVEKGAREKAHKVIQRELPTSVDDKTIILRAREAADLYRQIDALDAASEAAMEEARGTKKKNDGEVEKLREQAREKGRIVREGKERRNVDVGVIMDWDKKEVREVRLDSDEVVTVRGMTKDELQKPLPFPKDKDKPAKPELKVDNTKKDDTKPADAKDAPKETKAADAPKPEEPKR